MKIGKIILWTTALVVADQLLKLAISTSWRDLNFEILPSMLEFKPTLNNRTFYWLGKLNIDVTRWVRLAVSTVLFGVLCLLAGHMRAKFGKQKWIDAGFVFSFAGMLCSVCDEIFFGGSWDYLYLKPLFVFDLKDVYLNCFPFVIVIGVLTNSLDVKKR